MKGFSHIFLVLLLYSAMQTECIASSEPACSKFDYEEKLLAKTIRLENTVDDVSKTLAQVQTGLTECKTERKEIGLELETLRNAVEKQNTSTLQTMTELEAKVSAISMQMNETMTQAAPEASTCPSTYKYHAELNLCWRLDKGRKVNWLTAGWQCHTEGGHLMILDFMAKIKFIQYFLVTAASTINTVYVGATDVMTEGTFM